MTSEMVFPQTRNGNNNTAAVENSQELGIGIAGRRAAGARQSSATTLRERLRAVQMNSRRARRNPVPKSCTIVVHDLIFGSVSFVRETNASAIILICLMT